ncbi:hypothetical protein BD309DRAFT_242442 [Dichomitus squalens]|uniref:Uncharacterized protein n=1 Tax=Dichomitus squalens TaxID=114155 RepID=A0A4Q9Q2J9_9APHY|nr:hypothetical protein BD309DRAFT_242442 [Dichomitus squalens]TBU61260.1 hypothetical protein BD310DRAFT_216227 [Dichomitus squalens]
MVICSMHKVDATGTGPVRLDSTAKKLWWGTRALTRMGIDSRWKSYVRGRSQQFCVSNFNAGLIPMPPRCVSVGRPAGLSGVVRLILPPAHRTLDLLCNAYVTLLHALGAIPFTTRPTSGRWIRIRLHDRDATAWPPGLLACVPGGPSTTFARASFRALFAPTSLRERLQPGRTIRRVSVERLLPSPALPSSRFVRPTAILTPELHMLWAVDHAEVVLFASVADY